MPDSNLTLAVAGSRKTQSIVEACNLHPKNEKILILTYTTANQAELNARLNNVIGEHANIEVSGWFSFLIHHFVKPYLPYLFDDKKVRGFDFESPPRRGLSLTNPTRYFNNDGSVLKVHLPQLAHRVNDASGGQAIERLSRLYDKIYIDEVQDLNGYDLDILDLLINSDIKLQMVGDIRQAIIVTNVQEPRNGPFKYMQIWGWFKNREDSGLLTIEQNNKTWRCRQEIADFADSLFDTSWGFMPTESLNDEETEHDGLFIVKPDDVPAYLELYSPLFLRQTANSGRGLPYDFTNIGLSKGLTRERILILPTQPFKDFIAQGSALTDSQASMLYVGATRAEQSVAFVMNDTELGQSNIEVWHPTN